MMREPKRHLSLYLMKPGTSVDQTIRDPSKASRHELSAGSDLDGALFVKTSFSDVPWWVEFLDPMSVDDIKAPSSRTTSAVLSLRLARTGRNAKTVCFTFGHGRHLLDHYRIDRSFGLRVALNTVDPVKLRGFDTRRQDDVVVNARVQSSTGTDLAAFDLDTYRDILTKAAGVTLAPYTAELGSIVRGSDGLSFDVPIDPGALAARARQVLKLYRRDDYKSSFPFVDYIQPVDALLAEELDITLGEGLQAHCEGNDSGFRCLYLAAPEVLDLDRLEGFAFSSEWGSEKTVHAELRLEDYLDTRRGRSHDIDVETTRRDRVLLRYEGEVDRRLGSAYRCLIAEIELRDATFQLVDGKWYQIESSFVTRIRGIVSAIPQTTIVFPDHSDGDEEKDYNTQAAQTLGALLMDRKNISLGGGSNRVEFCDLALADRTLVHAKKRSSSSTLSHLWSQGTVAMEALLGDQDFREAVRAKVCQLDAAFEDIAAEGLSGADYQVVYLIIGVDTGEPTWKSLPFFSQVALAQAVRTLSSMGVRTAISGVPSV